MGESEEGREWGREREEKEEMGEGGEGRDRGERERFREDTER